MHGMLVKRFFINLVQVGGMPEAMVGVRALAKNPGAQTPRVTWTTIRMRLRGFRNITGTGMGLTRQSE